MKLKKYGNHLASLCYGGVLLLGGLTYKNTSSIALNLAVFSKKEKIADTLRASGNQAFYERLNQLGEKYGVVLAEPNSLTIRKLHETLGKINTDPDFPKFLISEGFSPEEIRLLGMFLEMYKEVEDAQFFYRLVMTGSIFAIFAILGALYDIFHKKTPEKCKDGLNFEKIVKACDEFGFACDIIKFNDDDGKIENFEEIFEKMPRTVGGLYTLTYFINYEVDQRIKYIKAFYEKNTPDYSEASKIKQAFIADLDRLTSGNLQWNESPDDLDRIIHDKYSNFCQDFSAMRETEHRIYLNNFMCFRSETAERLAALETFEKEIKK